MSGMKIDIQWSPVDEDLFITTGSAITLYRVKDEVETDQTANQASEKIPKTLRVVQEDSKSDLSLMKCVAWCPKRDLKNAFAVAQTNGRITITAFGDQSDDIVGKEFYFRHNRQCSYLSWNPLEINLLAQGLERHRNEPSILIWDVMRDVAMDMGNRHSFSEGPLTKPFCEAGCGDSSQSFSWFPDTPKVFASGMLGKFIRIYDIRDTNKHHKAVTHKCVAGVSIDPTDSNRIASYFEDVVAIWDFRSFDKPTQISLISESKPVVKLSWCPTRSGILSVLSKDSPSVKLHDIRLALSINDDCEQTYIARNIQPLPKASLSSFCWHPWQENKMMTVTPNGHLRDLVVSERIPMTWSSNLKLNMPISEDKMSCTKVAQEDIADLMKKRVKLGYGVDHQNIAENMKAIKTERHLHGLWKWLYNIKAIDANENPSSKRKVPLAKGILALIHGEESSLKSDSGFMNWKSTDTKYTRKRVYKSPERSLALKICGWCTDHDLTSVNEFILSILANEEPERAAAIGLFNLHIKYSIEILSTAKKRNNPDKSTLQAVAMALSGYTEEKDTLWHKTCDNLRAQLVHPYLRAIFAFLAADNDNYDEVLKSISVEDRIAFALIYLPDNKLKIYLLKLCDELIEKGDLDGILLTGLSPRGISLLCRYMDLSSDVQTAALVAVFSASPEVMQNKQVMEWVDGYRDLLDRWKMWHERAWFDIVRQSLVQEFKVPPQILVACTFCRKPVMSNTSLMNKFCNTISSVLQGSQNRGKVTCCQGCRKAFPRCAICLNNMGTLSGAGADFHKGGKLSPFEEWFTWCQTCRHGGHAGHIMEWFREQSECPVTGCNCECVSQDAVSQTIVPGNAIVSKS